MKILKKISDKAKTIVAGTALTTALMFGGNAEAAEPVNVRPAPKTSITLSDMASFGNLPTLRLESLTTGLPGNTSLYGTWEKQGDHDFYLGQLETMPLSLGNFNFGLVGKHVDGTSFDASDNYGLAMSVAGNITENTFGKGTVRYFPKLKSLTGYAFLDNDTVFADMLASHNTSTKDTSLTLGADFKLPNGWTIGPEVKMAGTLKDLKKDYVGVRLKKSW